MLLRDQRRPGSGRRRRSSTGSRPRRARSAGSGSQTRSASHAPCGRRPVSASTRRRHAVQLVDPVTLRQRREDRLVQPAAEELHLAAGRRARRGARGTRVARRRSTPAGARCSGARAGHPGGARAPPASAGRRARRPPRTPSRSCRPAGGCGWPARARCVGRTVRSSGAERRSAGGRGPGVASVVMVLTPGSAVHAGRPGGTAARRTRAASGSWRSARSCAAIERRISCDPAGWEALGVPLVVGGDQLLLQDAVQVLDVGPVLGPLVGIGLAAADRPAVVADVQPSSHQPSRTLTLTTPFAAAFMPDVPDASSGRRGLFEPDVDALDQEPGDPDVVVLEDEDPPAERRAARPGEDVLDHAAGPGRSAGWALPAKMSWTGRSASQTSRASRSRSVKSSAARL